MADGGRRNEKQERQRTKDARKFSELLRGRLTEKETLKLLENNGWDLGRAVDHFFHTEPLTLATILGKPGHEARISGITEDQVLRDLADRHEIGDSIRQFACGDCKHSWWYRVTNRKPVSTCRKCIKKYDAIPRDQEWGWAEFDCECGNTFSGSGAMGRSGSMCYACSTMCMPVRINPPRRNRQRRSNKNHTCSGENCFNKQGHVHTNDKCVHPKSQPPKILVESRPHVSTGSTVKTFLSQEDLETQYDPDLESIMESDGDEN